MIKRNVICIVIAIVFIFGAFFYHKLFVTPLEQKHDALITEYGEKQNEHEAIQSKLKMDTKSADNSVTAVSNDKIEKDTKAVNKYLEKAFSYASEDDFKANKEAMKKKAGDAFVKVCMPDVDFSKNGDEKLLRKLSGVYLCPKKLAGGTYIYDVVAEYYIYADPDDLEAAQQLNKNYALIELTVNNNQKVSDVKAVSLFDSVTDISEKINDETTSTNKGE